MDLSKIVSYERLFPLSLRHPATDEETGVVFNIRSAESEEAKQVLARLNSAGIERRYRSRIPKSEQLVKEELEKAASYIASWDWGENTYEGRTPGAYDTKLAMRILEREGWIFDQVVRTANRIENFTEASRTTSSNTSD